MTRVILVEIIGLFIDRNLCFLTPSLRTFMIGVQLCDVLIKVESVTSDNCDYRYETRKGIAGTKYRDC
jgi:hypothetical protein